MIFTRQSFHVTSGMPACSSGRSQDLLQHKTQKPHRALHGVSIGLHRPVQRTTVSVYAGNTSSVPPTRVKRKRDKSDAISMLREGESPNEYACFLAPKCHALRLNAVP